MLFSVAFAAVQLPQIFRPGIQGRYFYGCRSEQAKPADGSLLISREVSLN